MKKIDKVVLMPGVSKDVVEMSRCPSEYGMDDNCELGCVACWNTESSTEKQKEEAEKEIICKGCNGNKCKDCYSGSNWFRASVLTKIKRIWR